MYGFFRSMLFRLEPELAHWVATGTARMVQAARVPVIAPFFSFEHQALTQTLWTRKFTNPIGLAAGFDKNARLIPFWQSVGFGFAEVGSISARRARGNPRPRAFRLPEDHALVNRMGLNNRGAERVAGRIRRHGDRTHIPVGVNLAKTHDPNIAGEGAIEDFRQSFRMLGPLADYVALNVSCPNTPDGKTFEEPDALDALLKALFAERRELGLIVPILIKMAPPISDRVVFDSSVEEIVAVAMDHGVHGFIATNTAPDRQGMVTAAERLRSIGDGGLSGSPIEHRATRLVRYLYRRTGGTLPIIGVGGVATAAGAYAKIRAGASLVQLYTALVYEGPGVVKRIKEELVELMREDGLAHVTDAVGLDA